MSVISECAPHTEMTREWLARVTAADWVTCCRACHLEIEWRVVPL